MNLLEVLASRPRYLGGKRMTCALFVAGCIATVIAETDVCALAGLAGDVKSSPAGRADYGICVRAISGEGVAMRRSVIGVNHLAYGLDGYGMLLPGKHTPDPQLVAMQKEIGFGSLRYPGGCGGTHSFYWKKNAGLDGSYRVMGVVEFLDMCERIGAEPILGLSACRGTSEEASEYVEFLNAPADDAHPWARKRAERGRVSPYGVRYFEYGNETYHGTHPRPGEAVRRIAPQEYAANYLAFQAAMKAVDPGSNSEPCSMAVEPHGTVVYWTCLKARPISSSVIRMETHLNA